MVIKGERMNKKEFLEKLLEGGGDDALVSYYDELISDRCENGEDETAVVGGYDVRKILRVVEFETAKKELETQTREKKKTKSWIVVLALCSTPVTIPLAIAFAAIIFALAVSVFAFLVASVAGVFYLIAGAVEMMIMGDSAAAVLLHFGAGLVALGIVGLLGYYGAKGLKICYNWLSIKFFSKARRVKA